MRHEIYRPEGEEREELLAEGAYLCEDCGAVLEVEFKKHGGWYLQCPACGFIMEPEEDNSFYDEDDDDEIPEGCLACGGPYPECTASCPIFDD